MESPKGLSNVFTNAGLMKYWFPLSKMPQNGQDWPLVRDMVADNTRLIVFTSVKSKEASEGIAYQRNYMVENQCKKSYKIYISISTSHVLFFRNELADEYLYSYTWLYFFLGADGDGGMNDGECPAREQSPPLDDKTKSLVLVNFFRSVPLGPLTCGQNSASLINMLKTCHNASGNRWANFVAVDYYKVTIHIPL